MARLNLLILSIVVSTVSCSSRSLPAGDPTARALAGVVPIATSPAEYLNYYQLNVFAKYRYDDCSRHCPVVDLYVSLIGEGDPPEISSFFVASGYAWRFESWEQLPAAPLPDSGQSVRMRLSHIPAQVPTGERQELYVSANFERLRITEQLPSE